eukprot:TRINITY_DN20115_c0_g1_i1.p1 TRINITY_DN20115_c0_g1~~TRINITY_DN20115_c0_g1_i1.p1  ORF type:complete len:534 (-),score=179.86 TRINITY_DN20115_c0_g1_i1:166-1767(-)
MWDPEENQQRVPLLRGQGRDFGKPLEPDATFRGVRPSSERRCNDVLFAIAFVAMFAAMTAIAITGFVQGNPALLVPTSDIPAEEWAKNATISKAEYWFQDAVYLLKKDMPVLAGALAGSIVLAAVWVQLMRMFTRLFIWLTLIVGVCLVIALGIYVAAVGHGDLAPVDNIGHGSIAGNHNVMIVGYVIVAIGIVLAIVCVCMRSKIDLTAAMFEEACKGVQNNPSVFIVTLLVMALFAAFCAAWLAQFVYLYSIPSDTVDPSVPRGFPTFNMKVRNLMYFQVFGFLWTSAFLSGVFQVSVAGAIASWYFSRSNSSGETDVGSPALVTLGRAFTLSFGSIALGSLILAVVQFVNFLLQQAKKASGKNKLVVFLVSCIQCCLGCLASLVKFIDRFAYIYIAMHGEGFCSSAKNCFALISRNAVAAVLVDYLGDFVMWVGRLLGMAGTTLLTMVVVHGVFDRQVSYVTLSVVAVMSFAVFTIFSRVLSMGASAVFVCYMEDQERNPDGALCISPHLHQQIQSKSREVNEKSGSCCC